MSDTKSNFTNSAKNALQSTLLNKGAFNSDAMKVVKSIISLTN